MSFFVQSTAASVPKTPNIRLVSTALAAVFVVLVTAQLYSFEDFPRVIESFWLPGGEAFAQLVAALLVTGEVSAIPFLLSMRLSPAMRVVSMVAGWLVIASWLTLAVWINVTVNAVSNAGLLGATVSLSPGWWMVFLFAALAVLAGWASWGMWPLHRPDKQ
ncbi:MAG TPA: hypothetical protein VFM68_02330 [Candidatus Saccharimonadales bacterium]|nr:hypothetical protein [Candidatus Saccharimonadales bacterium]